MVQRCIAGDAEAQAVLCADYAPIVKSAVLRQLTRLNANAGEFALADDLVQEVLERLLVDDCRLMLKLHKPRSIHAWLVTLARRHVVDRLKRDATRARYETAYVAEDAAPADTIVSYTTPSVSTDKKSVAPQIKIVSGFGVAVIFWGIAIFGFGALQIVFGFAAVAAIALVVLHTYWASVTKSMHATQLRALQMCCALIAIIGVGLALFDTTRIAAACSIVVSALIVAASTRSARSVAQSNPETDDLEEDAEWNSRHHGTGGP